MKTAPRRIALLRQKISSFGGLPKESIQVKIKNE